MWRFLRGVDHRPLVPRTLSLCSVALLPLLSISVPVRAILVNYTIYLHNTKRCIVLVERRLWYALRKTSRSSVDQECNDSSSMRRTWFRPAKRKQSGSVRQSTADTAYRRPRRLPGRYSLARQGYLNTRFLRLHPAHVNMWINTTWCILICICKFLNRPNQDTQPSIPQALRGR